MCLTVVDTNGFNRPHTSLEKQFEGTENFDGIGTRKHSESLSSILLGSTKWAVEHCSKRITRTDNFGSLSDAAELHPRSITLHAVDSKLEGVLFELVESKSGAVGLGRQVNTL